MSTKSDGEVRELEAKVRVLEEENVHLSERAEEMLLLGIVSESMSVTEEEDNAIESVLERISIRGGSGAVRSRVQRRVGRRYIGLLNFSLHVEKFTKNGFNINDRRAVERF